MQLVRYGSISTFRERIPYELGCGRSYFYRATGEYPLTLEQQAIVCSVFEEFDIDKEDLFDAYEDAYYLPYYFLANSSAQHQQLHQSMVKLKRTSDVVNTSSASRIA